MLKVLNVTTPATAFTVAVPLRVPPPGFAPIAKVTGAPLETLLLYASRISAWTLLIAAPAVVSVGCVVTTSCVAPAVFTLIDGLVFGVFAPFVASDAVTVAVPAV